MKKTLTTEPEIGTNPPDNHQLQELLEHIHAYTGDWLKENGRKKRRKLRR
jgi:hypothetical protein